MNTQRPTPEEMARRIGDRFDEFVERRLNDMYRFRDVALYADAETSGGNQVFLSQYVKTEHDLAMKFGSFLEEAFVAADESLSVHAEIGLFKNSSLERADLSVHRLSGKLWCDK